MSNIDNLEGRLNLKGEFIGKDKNSHLGGCSTHGDAGTYYPEMWKFLIENYKISSVLDVGCGAGWSTKYFRDKGLKTVVGIEGLQDAIDGSPVKELLIQHDFEKSAFAPDGTYDLCWSCEFVEHVEESCAKNFIESFKKCKYLAMTFAAPGQTGHHHVNCQPENYWIDLLEKNGFKFDRQKTEELREHAKIDMMNWEKTSSPWYACFHFIERGLFFYNTSL